MRRLGVAAVLVLAVLLTASSIELLALHGGDGQVYYVNTAHISSLRQPIKGDVERYFAQHVRCIVSTDNGKFIAVIETCDDIRNKLTAR